MNSLWTFFLAKVTLPLQINWNYLKSPERKSNRFNRVTSALIFKSKISKTILENLKSKS